MERKPGSPTPICYDGTIHMGGDLDFGEIEHVIGWTLTFFLAFPNKDLSRPVQLELSENQSSKTGPSRSVLLRVAQSMHEHKVQYITQAQNCRPTVMLHAGVASCLFLTGLA